MWCIVCNAVCTSLRMHVHVGLYTRMLLANSRKYCTCTSNLKRNLKWQRGHHKTFYIGYGAIPWSYCILLGLSMQYDMWLHTGKHIGMIFVLSVLPQHAYSMQCGRTGKFSILVGVWFLITSYKMHTGIHTIMNFCVTLPYQYYTCLMSRGSKDFCTAASCNQSHIAGLYRNITKKST